ncbi:MAG TPA: ATP-binding protein [Rhodocyclaceae bacterium]|nr:ATP-binding protein [Rhodocyclaceae bacterium]
MDPPGKGTGAFTARHLRRRYVTALSVIALLTLVSQFVVQLTVADQGHDSRIVNIAGRQRMLSQKITKTIFYLANARNPEQGQDFRRQLEEALSLWQRSHAGLQHGDPELGLPGKNSPAVTKLFQEIEPNHQAIVTAARSVLASPGDAGAVSQGLQQISANEPAFLQGMDAIVFQYDAEAKDRVAFAKNLEIGLAGTTLFVLMLEALFIFAPAVKRLADYTDRLKMANEELASDIKRREIIEEELKRRNVELTQLNSRLAEAQEQLLQSEKMASLGQLAAGVAHEINNPIGFVQSNIGTLEGYLRSLMEILDVHEKAESSIADSGQRQRIHRVRERIDLQYLKEDMPILVMETRAGIARVKKIVQYLRNFSRVDGAQQWEKADLHQGIDSTLNIVANELKYKADVVKEYGQLPEVECIQSQLNQVFLNLLVNAAYAIGNQRGRVTIRTGTEAESVWLEFADTGCGIPVEIRSKIFEPFFTTKPVGKGTGLGLSLSYGIVKNHHGTIEVDSEVGQGTTFRLRLPIRQPRPGDGAST